MRVSWPPLSKRPTATECAVSNWRPMRAGRSNGSVRRRNELMTRYFPETIGSQRVIPNIELLHKLADSPLLDGILESNSLSIRELQMARSEFRRRKSVRRESHKRDGDLLSHR
jgi:hypothetical protein